MKLKNYNLIFFLKELKKWINGVRSLNKHEIKIIEPNINIEYAIHVPQTGLVDYKNLNKVFINEYTSLGGEILTIKKLYHTMIKE